MQIFKALKKANIRLAYLL